eukprot:4465899-Pleurochrysis_carterae.AAC.1
MNAAILENGSNLKNPKWGIDDSQEWKWQEWLDPMMRINAGRNRWSHEYRTAAAVRHVTLYSVRSIYLLNVVILAIHVALVCGNANCTCAQP